MKYVSLIALMLFAAGCGAAPGINAHGNVNLNVVSPDNSQPGASASPTPNPILLAEPTNTSGPCTNIGGNDPICAGIALHWMAGASAHGDGYWTCALDASQNIYCWNIHNTYARVTMASDVTTNGAAIFTDLVFGNNANSGTANEVACFTESDTNSTRCAQLI